MSENREVIEALQEFFDGLEGLKARLYHRVTAVPKPVVTGAAPQAPDATAVKWAHSKINWKEAVGAKGPFMIAERGKNEGNPDFEELLKFLVVPKSFGSALGFYWLFDSGDAVGFKPRKGAGHG